MPLAHMLGAVNVSPRPVNSSISSACCASSRQSTITFHCDAGASSSSAAGGSFRWRGAKPWAVSTSPFSSASNCASLNPSPSS